MKRFAALLLTLGILTTSLTAAVPSGSPAPDFSLSDTQGQVHRLSDYKGKYVVLEWTNHQCPFVVKHYRNGDMQALQQELTDQGVVWLQVVSSGEGKQGYISPEQGEAVRDEKQMHSSAMLRDVSGAVGRLYDARTTPHLYLIDPAGTLIYQGAIDSIRSTQSSDVAAATNYVKSALQQSRAGQPIDPATTTAYGCGVKY